MTEIDPVVLAGLQSLPFQTGILDADGDIYFTNWKWSEFREEHGVVGPADHSQENYIAACEQSENPDGLIAAQGLRGVLSGDRPDFTVEYSIRPETGRRWFLLRAVGYEHDDERYALLVHIDITNQKQVELDFHEQNHHLELLLRTIRHDIRGPLMAARGWTELLEADYEDERLDRVENSLERMEQVLEGPLTLIHRKDELEETEPVDLKAAAERAWSHIDSETATLETTESVMLDADPDLLAHVFENLFRNAIEHAGPDAHVRVGTTEDGFYIADDGPGIPEVEREQVFESGYTTNEQGRGFGLAIVERIVSLHGWTVSAVTSDLGGARFEFSDVDFAATTQD